MKEIKTGLRNILPISENIEKIGTEIVDSAYKVHKKMGPGLLEKVYEACLGHELSKRGPNIERQVEIPIKYDGVTLDEGLIIDLLVERKIIIELKAVEKMNPLWKAQILSHLKLTKLRLGFLINFNTINIGKGINRVVL